MKTKFNGKMITLPDGMRMMTHEGAGAPQALIDLDVSGLDSWTSDN